MKKLLLLAATCICSSSTADNEPSAYYDEDRHQVVVENSDAYTVQMGWLDKTTFIDVDVCLMPQNEEIHLYASHSIEDIK
jgi:hypothetical protein